MDKGASEARPANTSEKMPSADRRVFDAILKAVFEQRISPGIKLGEEPLAQVFKVSRSRIRRVLLSLSHHNVVDLFPNRGAFVARPSEDDARDIFSARRVLEELVIRRVTDSIDAAGLKALRAHVRAETVAREKGQRREAIRMAGEFHLLLAQLSGSRVYCGIMEALTSQSSLIVSLFGAGLKSSCSVEEHAAIIEAIRKRDTDLVCETMQQHLLDLEGTLRLDLIPQDQADLRAIFGTETPATDEAAAAGDPTRQGEHVVGEVME